VVLAVVNFEEEEVVTATVTVWVEGDEELVGSVGGCLTSLWFHVLACLTMLCAAVVVEASAAFVSMRGTILETAPRASMKYLLYIRLGK